MGFKKLSLFALAPLANIANAASCLPQTKPFQPIDPQNWVNPDDMIWADYKKPPGTSWNDPTKKGSERNFNIALVTVDYDDMPFVITQPPNSTIFGNPLPLAANYDRKDVPAFYRDLLNKPSEMNRGHTIHEYWMEDSAGRFGVDLTVYGAYRLPAKSFEYGIDNWMNPGACPANATCNRDLRDASFKVWRADVGNQTADAYELVFILSAGQDESSTWQEFGEMKFQSKDDVPEPWGPPEAHRNDTTTNYAATRYVPWTSWASAAALWPNAGSGSSIQCESSGMATYAHELSHLLTIPDNYNNPYGNPLRRSYTGPFSMLSRGSFNGPGGPHSRWHIPALQGGALGSPHSMRDKNQIGLVTDDRILKTSKESLAKSGIINTRITARTVRAGFMGVRVDMGTDLSPKCDYKTDVLCDGGNYTAYDLEVIDRMGSDSFQSDSGVMISKIKYVPTAPFQWTIDANPQDINLTDFHRPDGTAVKITMGDYRQLADALFHAGTNSNSEFEHIDKANRLHMYIISPHRSKEGVLSYDVGVRLLNSTSPHKHGAQLAKGQVVNVRDQSPTTTGVYCQFELSNNGTMSTSGPANMTDYMNADIYRLKASTKSQGWRVQIPNELIKVEFGKKENAFVAVGACKDAAATGSVVLKATSESDQKVSMEAVCEVLKT